MQVGGLQVPLVPLVLLGLLVLLVLQVPLVLLVPLVPLVLLGLAAKVRGGDGRSHQTGRSEGEKQKLK